MKPSEIIDTALTEIIPTEREWTQSEFQDAHGGCCLLGALGVAFNGNWMQGVLADLGTELDRATREIAAIIKDGPCLPGVQGLTITEFNDSHTYDEVRAVAEKARAALQERGL